MLLGFFDFSVTAAISSGVNPMIGDIMIAVIAISFIGLSITLSIFSTSVISLDFMYPSVSSEYAFRPTSSMAFAIRVISSFF